MAVDMEQPQTRRRADSRRGNDQADWVWKAPRPDFVRGADEPEEAWHARVNADAQRLMKAYDVVHEAEGGEKEPQRRVRVQREYDTALLLGDKLQVYYKENSQKLGNTDAARDTLKAICDKFAKVQEDRQRQDVRSRKSAETKSHGKPKYERRKSGPPAEKESESDEDAPQPAHKALSVLKALQDRADHGEFYSRGASDSLAQAWAEGDRKTTKYTPSNRRHEEVTRAELISMENAEAKSASGVTLQVALDDFKRCAEIIKQLGDNINEDLDAEETYDAYDDALARYQAFVSRITDSLTKPGVKKHLGAAYKPLFEANLSAFEETSKKLIEAIGDDLDEEEEHRKPKNAWDMSSNNGDEKFFQTEETLNEWTGKTKKLLKDGLAAASG